MEEANTRERFRDELKSPSCVPDEAEFLYRSDLQADEHLELIDRVSKWQVKKAKQAK